MVNADIKAPRLPPWAKDDLCERCGDLYANFVPGISFEDGCQRVRQVNQEADGGFRSRGPVLWAMHVLKLEAWCVAHSGCLPRVTPCVGCQEVCPWCDLENGG